MNKFPRSSVAGGLLLTAVCGALSVVPARSIAPPAMTGTDAAKEKFFSEQVRPIFEKSCLACHGGKTEEASGKLSLATREAFLKGGASGPAIQGKNPHESLLIKAIRYEGRQMPPQGKLPQAQIDILTRWVKMGAPWSAQAAKGKAAEPAHHGPPPVDAKARQFWSFLPVKRPALPKVKNAAWVKTPIDAFVLAKLEKNGLSPAPAAPETALLRRITYDLTGLPPTETEVRAFLADQSPNAYEKVVDRLLASPHYGERWARHWLDLVRYAETNSFERDGAKPFVWRYRDYVIRAFNEDKPYDRFLKEQLAGDEIAPGDPSALIATGYYRLGQWDDEPADPEQARYDELDDIVATTGQVMLGVSINCARCHDHKIDPVPQKDYYRLLSFFQGLNLYGVRSRESVEKNSLRSIAPEAEQKRFAEAEAVYKKQVAENAARIDAIEKVAKTDFAPVEHEEFKDEVKRPGLVKKRVPARISAAQFAEYEQAIGERERLRKNPPPGLEKALCVTEAGPKPPPTFVLMRGNPHVPGEPVEPGFPSVLSPPVPALTTPAGDAASSGRRAALAAWITSPGNPLTARVMVNRIWQYHFGRGIVRSSSNFGYLGTAPTHPELLDWLASEFVKPARGGAENAWRLKPLHRMIVMSSAYRMSSRADVKALKKDPENDLLWRFDMRRLEAEEIRDSILAVNGTLNRAQFGPSVYPAIPREVLAGQSVPGAGWGKSTPEEQARRSIYIHIKRSLTVPLLASFDSADTDTSCPVRFATTQPTQALSMLNSAFIGEQARLLADDLRTKAGDAGPAAQVRLALSRVLQRPPTMPEVQRGLNFMAGLRKGGVSEKEALRCFCVVALNLNEFVYLD